ncbi:hypothetical protein [Reinekea blandensis]|uniref:DUF1127 domain-containing protein n=1 Tax=Reinekea blandensis MED297 TaxID=314283 RepID=A4B912_9GAMM|nr:hypothetical protein [Reinekea blandensis]EAR11113.1 hypothetical protein MED297_19537 [Reinekea sp. MED297] [Reinekea blandensis MED297]
MMNLLKTFARIRILFTRNRGAEVRLIDLNDHLRRDLGIDNASSDRRVHEHAPRAQEFIISNVLTRAP